MFLQGEAASEITKTPDDNNPNYCSLQNLIDGEYPDASGFPLPVYMIFLLFLMMVFCSGSDLISAEGYKQFSNKWICPGFDTANCTLPHNGIIFV